MQEMNRDDFFRAVRSFGASDVGITRVSDGPAGLPFSVSAVVRLSDAIIDEIGPDGPTYTYFNHYRSVNYLIDQILLKTGLWLQSKGARYITVAASQSQPDSPFEGRYSHKKAAVLAGLGSIGLNGLFLHREWGPRVRLGTVFTDWPGIAVAGDTASVVGAAIGAAVDDAGSGGVSAVAIPAKSVAPFCASCRACVGACPAGAIGTVANAAIDGQLDGGKPDGHQSDSGQSADRQSADRIVSFDPARCSAWMKKAYQNIGRGAVCGICVAVCPAPRGCASS